MASGKKRKKKGKTKGKRLTLVDVKSRLAKDFADSIMEFEIRDKKRVKYLEMYIKKESVLPIATALKDMGFEHCSMISAVDWKDRFEVVYHISSYKHNLMVQLTAQLPHERPAVDSVANLWGGANWHEREAWDLMGIMFVGHPNLKRVLLPDDFEGHPLRKDYKEVD
jgi:NADH-quinone oxidoreductase subunit C